MSCPVWHNHRVSFSQNVWHPQTESKPETIEHKAAALASPPRYPIQTTVLMIGHCGYLKAEPANDNASDWHSWCDTAQTVFFCKTIICWVCIVE